MALPRIRSAAVVAIAALALSTGLAACSQDDTENSAASTGGGDLEAAIALGVVPVAGVDGPLGIKCALPKLVPMLKNALAGKE